MPEDGLLSRLKNLRELDLRANLISSFQELAVLGKQLPSMKLLNIAENRFATLTSEAAAELKGVFGNLKTLIISETNMTWPEVQLLDVLAPQLEELHAANNNMTRLPDTPPVLEDSTGEVHLPSTAAVMPTTAFLNLKTLNISGNGIDDWCQVYALATLPSLAWLLVSDNKLTKFWCGGYIAEPFNVYPFARLEQLSITGNRLPSPADLDGLDSFPNLTYMRIQNTDLAFPDAAALGPSEARQVIVSRLPKLQTLNNSEVCYINITVDSDCEHLIFHPTLPAGPPARTRRR
jgi:Leucine-rich repeat (LRR) protein